MMRAAMVIKMRKIPLSSVAVGMRLADVISGII